LDDFAVNAAPRISASASGGTISSRFLFRSIPFPTASLALFNGCLTDLSVDAAPNRVVVNYLTIPPRFLFGAKALTASLSALLFCLDVKDLVMRAAPTAAFCFTSGSRFGFGSVPMTASLIAIRPGHRDDAHAGGCVDTAPTAAAAAAAASFARIVFGTVTLAVAPLAVFFGDVNYFASVASRHAAPAHSDVTIALRFVP
jgi:hypothetical protein